MNSMEKAFKDLFEGMAHCMKAAHEENPEEAKNWTKEELFEKGADWAGRHVLLLEEEAKDE